MRITLDISPAVYGTGVSRYSQNLAAALSHKLSGKDRLTLYGASFRRYPELRESVKDIECGKHILPLPPRVLTKLFNFTKLPIETLVGKTDIFHAWDWMAPRTFSAHLVSTIHDLALFKFPETAHPEIREHHEIAILNLKDQQATIIAVSETTKKDLIDLFDYPKDKVHVVYEALPKEREVKITQEDVQRIKEEYGITKPYFMTVATFEPRKNLKRVVQAWKRYSADYQLVMVGKSGWEDRSTREGVVHAGFVPDKHLSALYAGAEALLYPSLYEGFGLPLLEAFYCNTPVVTSDRSATKEVAQDAAILVNPESVSAIERGIGEALKHSKELVKRGKKRLKDFSWKKVANETVAVYKKALQESN